MQATISQEYAQKFVGQDIYALKKDGSVVTGKLVKIQGNTLIMAQPNGKTVNTKGIFTPLVLFDLLAIGTSPFAFGSPFGFGGFGGGFGGFGSPFFF